MTTTTTRTIAVSLAVGAAILAGCGTAAQADNGLTRGQQADADRLTAQAEYYLGDPWETRFRDQFWARQHIHDSWNRCHLGENAPRPAGCDGTSLTPHR